jgi:hypothetical protein
MIPRCYTLINVIRLPVFEDIAIFSKLLIDKTLPKRPGASRASEFYVVGLQNASFPWTISRPRRIV